MHLTISQLGKLALPFFCGTQSIWKTYYCDNWCCPAQISASHKNIRTEYRQRRLWNWNHYRLASLCPKLQIQTELWAPWIWSHLHRVYHRNGFKVLTVCLPHLLQKSLFFYPYFWFSSKTKGVVKVYITEYSTKPKFTESFYSHMVFK